MNRSVSSFAPKDKTFCRTMNLVTRVSIAASIQILEHYNFWQMVLQRLGLEMSLVMELLLQQRDGSNAHQIIYRKRTDVKRRRKQPDTVKITEGIEKRKQQIADGTYGSGVANAAEQ